MSAANSLVGLYSLFIVDYATLRPSATKFIEELSTMGPDRPLVLLLSANPDKEALIHLLSTDLFTNLLAKNVDVSGRELLVTVQKLLRNDLFGFEKYLSWGVHPQNRTIRSSQDKAPLLDELETHLGEIGCNRRLAALARSVGDELIMNAVYNAPVDAHGNPKYASINRSTPVDLEPNEYAEFRYACDGRNLALSVSDKFGRLKRETVVNYLRKCFVGGPDQIDTKDGGAGLGLYYVFESLNQFIVNIQPGKRSELIGIIDVSGSYREFSEKPKTLNIFLDKASGS